MSTELLAALGFEVTVTSSSSDNKEATTDESTAAQSSRPARESAGKKSALTSDAVDSDVCAPVVVSANGQVEGGGGKKAKGVRKDKAAAAAAGETKSATEEVENKTESGSDGARPKDQLIYLSKIIGFKVSGF